MSLGPGEGTTFGPGSGSPGGASGGGISCGAGGRITSGSGVGMGSLGLGVGIFSSLLTEMRPDARLFRRHGACSASAQTGRQLDKERGPNLSCVTSNSSVMSATQFLAERRGFEPLTFAVLAPALA
jgi:hypothetical protein